MAKLFSIFHNTFESFFLISSMDIDTLNMYERLRDFHVPATLLDDIFSTENGTNIMRESWEQLKSDGLQEDEIAEAIAKLIIKEVDIPQGKSEEK